MPPIYFIIGEILAKKKIGKETATGRIIAIPIGLAACDIALAKLIYDTAVEKKVGRKINLMWGARLSCPG